jgi:UTP--glucose-1-phosphate uridylyltransferase
VINGIGDLHMTYSTTAITTVVIPAAVKGSRMLPATQITAKELLPVYDRLVIQFAIDEAIDAGASRIIVVVRPLKPEIRAFLGAKAVASTGRVAGHVNSGASPEIIYVTQEQPLGMGHAVLCCKDLTPTNPRATSVEDHPNCRADRGGI